MTWGTIASVDAVPLASDLVAVATVGDLTFQVDDVADFYAASGYVSLNGAVYGLVSINDATDTLTLASAVTVAGVVGDQVLVWDTGTLAGVVSLLAQVQPNGDDANGDPISALIGRPLFSLLPVGPRDPFAGGAETVRMEEDAHGTWWVTHVDGRAAPVLNSEYRGAQPPGSAVLNARWLNTTNGDEYICLKDYGAGDLVQPSYVGNYAFSIGFGIASPFNGSVGSLTAAVAGSQIGDLVFVVTSNGSLAVTGSGLTPVFSKKTYGSSTSTQDQWEIYGYRVTDPTQSVAVQVNNIPHMPANIPDVVLVVYRGLDTTKVTEVFSAMSISQGGPNADLAPEQPWNQDGPSSLNALHMTGDAVCQTMLWFADFNPLNQPSAVGSQSFGPDGAARYFSPSAGGHANVIVTSDFMSAAPQMHPRMSTDPYIASNRPTTGGAYSNGWHASLVVSVTSLAGAELYWAPVQDSHTLPAEKSTAKARTVSAAANRAGTNYVSPTVPAGNASGPKLNDTWEDTSTTPPRAWFCNTTYTSGTPAANWTRAAAATYTGTAIPASAILGDLLVYDTTSGTPRYVLYQCTTAYTSSGTLGANWTVVVPAAPARTTALSTISGAAPSSPNTGDIWWPGIYTSGGTLSDYQTAVLADSPWGFWPLNDASGTTLADASGNSRPLTANATLTAYAVSGPFSGSAGAQFATTGTTYANTAASSSTSNLTLECWVNLGSALPTAQINPIGRGINVGGGGGNWDSIWIDTSGIPHGSFWDTASNYNQVNGTGALSLNTWHHLAVTQAAGGAVVLYVDGVQVATLAGVTYGGANNPVQVNDGYNSAKYGPHQLFGAAYYQAVLTSTRIAAHYSASGAVVAVQLPKVYNANNATWLTEGLPAYTTAGRPTAGPAGEAYYDTTLSRPGYSDGTNWHIDTSDSAATTLSGTTAGNAIWTMPERDVGRKRVLVQLAGYENTTATAQTITFPTVFTYTPSVVKDDSAGATVSTTTLTLPASMVATITGWIILEGF